jgi:predicted SAM-dependent methyltransferase
MKLHIGSGSVYLDGWVNIDVQAPGTFLARNRPDLVERWKTTDDNYYGRHEDKTADSLRAGPLQQEYVCDAYGSFDNIPAPYWEADEILARHAFEHLSITEAHRALDQIDGLLKPNGILRLDVPDHEKTLKAYRETGDEFFVRHLLGPRRNDHGFHLMSYTPDRLRALVEEHGFVLDGEEENIHFYPAFCLRFVKPGPRAPRDYVQVPTIEKHWRVLEIGPGAYPFPRADFYLDKTLDHLQALQDAGKGTIVGDLESGLPRMETKSFDYLWCSHVLEHVDDPAECAKTMSRIAKRGTLVVPSALKEGMFAHEEREHKWLILPSPTDGPPIFVRKSKAMMEQQDPQVQQTMCRMFRTGPNRVPEQRYLRKWFYQNEASLDVVVHWHGELKVQVIG